MIKVTAIVAMLLLEYVVFRRVYRRLKSSGARPLGMLPFECAGWATIITICFFALLLYLLYRAGLYPG
jgi:hypothetical protein